MSWKIAAAQIDIKIGDAETNLQKMTSIATEADRQGSQLVIFPECALAGYCFDSKAEALPHGVTLPALNSSPAEMIASSPLLSHWQTYCHETGQYLIHGLLERDGDELYNTAILLGPQGFIGKYRKVHLPFLGVDRFTSYGQELAQVYDIEGLRLGMNICYDSSFPEPSRCLALAGADLIALPTNWPPGAECQAAYSINTRAMENVLYFAAANRVGSENGTNFIGQSSICDPLGKTIAQGTTHDEEILYAEVDPEQARQKLRIRIAHTSAVNRLGDRHPDLYGAILAPSQVMNSREEMNRSGQ